MSRITRPVRQRLVVPNDRSFLSTKRSWLSLHPQITAWNLTLNLVTTFMRRQRGQQHNVDLKLHLVLAEIGMQKLLAPMVQIIYPTTHKTLDLDIIPTRHETKNTNILFPGLRNHLVSLNPLLTIIVFRGTQNPGPGAYSAAIELHTNS
jgi:hypothetical protein